MGNSFVLNREKLLRCVGKEEQFAGIELREETEGRGKGIKVGRFYNISGLSVEVIPDRGMDIGKVSYRGIPVAWISPAYLTSGRHYSECGSEWGRIFFGGFLTTCGLLNAGPPSEGEGLHGRITTIEAEEVRKETYWVGDEYILSLSGKVRESKIFGENYLMKREIRMNHKDPSFEVFTVITNKAYREMPLMYLSHINFGYPFFSPELELSFFPPVEFVPRDEEARKDKPKEIFIFTEPKYGFKERVFFGEYKERKGEAQVRLVNRKLGLGIKMTWLLEEMYYITIWKMLGEGEYVLGVEPGNAWPVGQKVFKTQGRLDYLLPEEERTFYLKIEFFQVE